MVEGIVIGTMEAADDLAHSSTQVIVALPETSVSAPKTIAPVPVVVTPQEAYKSAPTIIPTTTIVTTLSDGTITTVTRQASAYELGPGPVIVPVDPAHRVGSSPHVNPYVFRYR